MFFSFARISSFLLASAVLANSLNHGQPSLAARAEVVITTYIAGAVLTNNDKAFQSVGASFNVPHIWSEKNASGAVWIGMGNFACNTTLRTGIIMDVNDEKSSYTAFSQWHPSSVTIYNNMTISRGDVIELYVHAQSATVASITINNRYNKQSIIEKFNSTLPLCPQEAKWFVEGIEAEDGLEPLPEFHEVIFKNASATNATGTYTPADGGIVYDIEQNGNKMIRSWIEEYGVIVKPL